MVQLDAPLKRELLGTTELGTTLRFRQGKRGKIKLFGPNMQTTGKISASECGYPTTQNHKGTVRRYELRTGVEARAARSTGMPSCTGYTRPHSAQVTCSGWARSSPRQAGQRNQRRESDKRRGVLGSIRSVSPTWNIATNAGQPRPCRRPRARWHGRMKG